MISDDLPSAAHEPDATPAEITDITPPAALGPPDARVTPAGSGPADRWRSPRAGSNGPQGEPPVLTLTLIPEPVKEPEAAPAKPRAAFLRRHAAAVAAAVLVGVSGGVVVQLLTKGIGSGGTVAVASAPAPAALPKPALLSDADLQTAQMAAQIKGLSAGLGDVRAKLAAMRASTDSLSASLDATRADVDHGRQADDIKALRKSVDSLKQGLDQAKADWAAAAAQVSQKLDRDPAAKVSPIADRLDRLERDQAAKLAQIADRLEKLEHRPTISADVTGSIPKPAETSVPAAPQPLPRPPSLAAAPAATPVIPGMQLLGVESGSAFVAGRDGGVFELAQGDWIPGVGKVESIERRGGEWVVVTNRGIIGSGRR